LNHSTCYLLTNSNFEDVRHLIYLYFGCMFDTSDDVYSYIAFAIVSLHVLYPLPSNIMHPEYDKIIKSFKYIIAKIHQIHK